MKKLLVGLVVVGALAVVFGGGLWWHLAAGQVIEPEPAGADTAAAVNLIRFSGEVVAKQQANLGFEATGVVQAVNVSVGDAVTAGQELIVLDRELQEAAVDSAYANRVSARDNALVALETAQSNLVKTKAENEQTVAKARQAVIDTKQEWDDTKEVFGKTASESGDEVAATATKKLAVTTAEKNYHAAQDALSEARQTADKENTAAVEAVRAAEATYAATNQASLTTAGPAALAALETSARVQLARKILMAPFSGTVTKLDLEPNELALAGQPIITLQSIASLEIEALVSETDITQLTVGTQAVVTFDALGNQEFSARVTRLNPAGEKIDGIPRYTAYLDLANPIPELNPGFTANVVVPE